MAEKRILVADADPKAWDEFRLALGGSWVVVGAATGSAAMAEAQKQPFDVVVANYGLSELDGAELLNRIRAANSRTLRFIAAAEARREEVICHVLGGHQFLAIPFDRATLKSAIERSLDADYGMSNALRELVGRIRTFPAIPSLYLEVVHALKNPNASTGDVGLIIARDMAMTTKLVQVLNSAYYGLPRTITDPTEAVGILGFETVKSLIMTVKLLSQYDKVKPVYFSIDHVWRHSTNVARTAKAIALLETGDTECSGLAFTGGLMHDLGKVILAANFDSQYLGAHTLARKRQIPLWEVEKDFFGGTHGEMGAYLLGLWGLSSEVVKVAALHHDPLRAGDKTFTALTAVHVANALEYEENPDPEGLPAPVLDFPYLQQLGLEKRIEIWRQTRRDPGATKFETKTHRTKSAAKPAQKDAAKAVISPPAPKVNEIAPAEAPSGPFIQRRLWQWLGLALGATAALALLARLEIMRLESNAEKAAVRQVAEDPPPPVNHEMAPVLPPAKVVQETKPAPAPPAKVALVLPTNAAPELAAQPPPTPAPTPAPPPAPAKTGLDRLKLQAILFNSQHPAALINGKVATLNEEVSECRVLEITPSSVTLEYHNQRKTLTLR